MLQSGPYPFRSTNRCPCRARCTDRVPTGRYLWHIAPDATGVWSFLQTARRISEFPSEGELCFWQEEYQAPDGPEWGREVVAEYLFGGGAGHGLPYFWRLTFSVEGIGPGFAGDFVSEAADIETEPSSCRLLPDPIPLLIADPANPRWPTGSTPGQVFLLWGGSVSPF